MIIIALLEFGWKHKQTNQGWQLTHTYFNLFIGIFLKSLGKWWVINFVLFFLSSIQLWCIRAGEDDIHLNLENRGGELAVLHTKGGWRMKSSPGPVVIWTGQYSFIHELFICVIAFTDLSVHPFKLRHI